MSLRNNNQGFRGAFDRSGSLVLFLLWTVGDEVISPFKCLADFKNVYTLFIIIIFLSGILIMYVGSLCRPLAVKLNTLTRE